MLGKILSDKEKKDLFCFWLENSNAISLSHL